MALSSSKRETDKERLPSYWEFSPFLRGSRDIAKIEFYGARRDYIFTKRKEGVSSGRMEHDFWEARPLMPNLGKRGWGINILHSNSSPHWLGRQKSAKLGWASCVLGTGHRDTDFCLWWLWGIPKGISVYVFFFFSCSRLFPTQYKNDWQFLADRWEAVFWHLIGLEEKMEFSTKVWKGVLS